MTLIRRSYVYLASAISLQAATWAVIALARNVIAEGGGGPREALAFQMAVIVIALPIYLFHWRWARRLAGRDEERSAPARRLYLYGTMALFLLPLLANVHGLLDRLLTLGLQAPGNAGVGDPQEEVLRALVAIVVLSVLWLYHWRVVIADRDAVGESGRSALIRRTYVLGFSALGVAMVAVGFIQLLRWLLFQLGSSDLIWMDGEVLVAGQIARLVVALPLWLVFWRWAQRLAAESDAERDSALRLFFLYATVFLTVVIGVGHAAMILAGALKVALDLPPGGDIRDALPVVIALAGGWLYFSTVLSQAVDREEETKRQARLRRLYYYLVAGAGLAAFLFGTGGLLTVLLTTVFGGAFDDPLKEQLAWTAAALLAGLLVWVPSWWRMQRQAEAAGMAGAGARSSVVRRLYLYLFLLVATVTVLSSSVYVVARIFLRLFGEAAPGDLAGDLARAIAYGLVGVGVWVYHGTILRSDDRRDEEMLAERLNSLRAAVVDGGEGEIGRRILKALREELPALSPDVVPLSTRAAEAMGGSFDMDRLQSALAEADIVVAPSSLLTPGGLQSDVDDVAQLLADCPAHKLLIPRRAQRWDWAGFEYEELDQQMAHVVAAARQIALGEQVKPARPLGVGALIGIGLAAILFLIFIGIPIIAFLAGSGLEYLLG